MSRVPLKQATLSKATPMEGSRVKPAFGEQGTTWGHGRGGRPWRRLVEQVKRRDLYTCQHCKKVTALGACDHIIPGSQGGSDELSNLQWLCDDGPTSCHAKKTALEAQAGKP